MTDERARELESLIRYVLLPALDDAIKSCVNNDWSQDDYDRWDMARSKGEAALKKGAVT